VVNIHKILPIAKTIVEVAAFDIQKIKNPDTSGKDCQQGDQMGFWNAGEYVLFRDGHACHGRRNCKNPILNVHRIESRKTGGDAPDNLITLCEDCHNDYRCAAFMGATLAS
ncbi:MAG: HNH endonuclease, partial [Clostridiales bacterium]|jgi:N6-L-threonylcarbamoyladenine synthase|nr:HNH endonuclease [Clostridiales bacterium]